MQHTTLALSRSFGRRVIIPLTAMLAVAFVLVFALLLQIARHQDASARDRTIALTEIAWSKQQKDQATLVEDYASWGAAYKNLHVDPSRDWAFTEDNLGRSLFTRYGVDYAFVINAADRTTYAVVGGELSEAQAEEVMKGELPSVLRQARAAPPDTTETVSGVLNVEGAPVLVSAAAISTAEDASVEPVPGPPSVLVFGRRMTPSALERLGRELFVPALRVARDDADARQTPRMVIGASTGAPFTLRWDPERPGSELLRHVLPWLALAAVVLTSFVALTFRYAAKAAGVVRVSTLRLADAYRDAEHQALHDPLTGLPNRALLAQCLDKALASKDARLAVLYLDLDRFKPVNDALGHGAGDQVLVEIASRLKKGVREDDLVARLGGDEFVILVRRSVFDVETLCRRLLEAVAVPIMVDENVVHVGASAGIALAPEDAMSADELLRSADLALYEAKNAGRETYRFFASAMNDEVVARTRLEAEIRAGIAAEEFFLLYQPRYDTHTMRIKGVEALLRWRHPTRGLVSPAEFIPLAEETGLIIPLGAWVLRTASQAATNWDDIGVSVNVSPAQFRGADFVATVRDVLAASGLSPHRLELELTEGVLLEDTDRAGRILHGLKELGVLLSMDDFGTGYSSLGYLKNFPFDAIKIDQRFIADLQPTGDARAIVQAVLGLGRALGLSVTAEGVETPEQLMLLRMDNCAELQGYLMSMPVSDAEISALIEPQRVRRDDVEAAAIAASDR